MKRVIFGLISIMLIIGMVFMACENGSTPTTSNGYGGFGVWLISQSDYAAYDGSKQPTPTAMGIIDTLSTNFSVDFYNPENYNTSENPGWNINSSQTSWTAVSGDYYVLLVPMYYPSGVAGQGDFWWMFEEGKISGSGTTPSPINIIANPHTFALTNFINVITDITKFEGTWYSPSVNVSEIPESPNFAAVEMTFSAYTFIFKMTFSDNSQMLYKGTFTYTDTTIKCITTHTSTDGSNWTPVSSPGQNQLPLQTYSFSGNDLILGEITLTKKP
jgi:hypothetical protein